MAQVEVEHRGLLTEKKFKELNKFLKKNGKFLAERDRFSVVYWPQKKEAKKLIRSPVDLRIRITNKKAELVLKYGKNSGNDARKEFFFPIDSKKFREATEFLQILGFYQGALQATKTYLYSYKGIEFALVKVPNWGYYFEAEIIANPDSIKNADKKIMSSCRELNLNILNDRNFYKLLVSLNKRPGFRFNFKKQNFSDIKKRFSSYF